MSGSALQQTRRSTRTLRDLLSESSISCPSPSNGFTPIPRNRTPATTIRSLIEMDLNSSSSRNSNPRILNSLLHALVKRFYSFAVKSRSVSLRFSRKSNSGNYGGSAETKLPLRIKDIVRWRSFRDLEMEEQPQPLDFSPTSSSCSSSSKGSSWSDSDFSSCDGNFVECFKNDVVAMKRLPPFVGGDSVYATTENPVGPKVSNYTEDLSLRSQEEEQRNPVSVLRIQEYEYNDLDDEYKLEGEKTDEKLAWKLLHCAKSSGSVQWNKANLKKLLLDFFEDELNKRRDEDDDEFECEILRRTQDWLNGSFGDDFENSDKNACLRDMDRREGWKKFEEEKQELAFQIETDILENLIVELFHGSFSC